MTLTRRAVLQAGAAAVATALSGCGTGRYAGPALEITIAGGQSGGFYLEIAHLLAREITAAEPRLRCSPVKTGGSADNVELLHTGQAQVGVSQSDIALAAVTGSDPYRAVVPVQGIGRMYEDYLQLVVLADSPFRSITSLAGKRVSLGVAGSGTAITGERLMSAAAVKFDRVSEPLNDAIASLRDRRVDAVLWSGGVPTAVLAALHAEVRIRLLPLDGVLRTLRNRYGAAYQKVSIPAGGYGEAGNPTIGVANLLLCERKLPDAVVAAITGVLVERAARLVPPQALGAQFLDRRSLINLLDVPMHRGARSAYHRLHG